MLSVRRAPGVPGLDGKWELPGGKIEFGETPSKTIVREIQEELGINIVPLRLLPYLHTNVWEYEHVMQHVVLACYECELDGRETPSVGADARWFHVNEIDFELTLPGTREFVSLAARSDWFDDIFIRFQYRDPSESVSKEFSVTTQRTLFSEYALVKFWGTIGSHLRMKKQAFDSPRELDEEIVEIAKRRLLEGYHITQLQGPENPYKPLLRIIELAKEMNKYSLDRIQ